MVSVISFLYRYFITIEVCATLKSVTFSIINYFSRKFQHNENTNNLFREEINEVLFFNEKNAHFHNDKTAICDPLECNMKGLETILNHIQGAKETLDLCIYTLTHHKFSHEILKKFNDGVKVRVITDHGTSYHDGSQIPEFRKNGVLVRTPSKSITTFLMHHKFAIVDETILINGSLNWTSQGVSGNDENVMITSSQILVKKYTDYFNKKWIELK